MHGFALLDVTQGQNLILNMNDHGFVVCAFNRTVEKVDKFLANEANGISLYFVDVELFNLCL